MSTFVAGWNQPGYLPDYTEEFDSNEDAVQFLRDTVERWQDEDWEEAFPEAFTADEIVSAEGFGEYAGYALWVEEIVS